MNVLWEVVQGMLRLEYGALRANTEFCDNMLFFEMMRERRLLLWEFIIYCYRNMTNNNKEIQGLDYYCKWYFYSLRTTKKQQPLLLYFKSLRAAGRHGGVVSLT